MLMLLTATTFDGGEIVLRAVDVISLEEQGNGSCIVSHKFGDEIRSTCVRNYAGVAANLAYAIQRQINHEYSCANRGK